MSLPRLPRGKRGRKRLVAGVVFGSGVAMAAIACRHYAPASWQWVCAAVAPVAAVVRAVLGV